MERINPYLNNIAYYLLLIFALTPMISNALAETLAVVILIIWTVQTLAYRRREWLKYPLFWPLAALIIYKTIVLLVSGYQGRFGTAFEQIALPLIYFMIPTIVVTSDRRRKVIWLFITGAVFAAGIGIIKYMLDIDPRARSIISGCNTLAFFLTIALAIILPILVYSKKLPEKIFLGMVSMPLFAGVMFTLTRTSYFIVGLYVVILGIIKDRKLLIAIAVIILAIFLLSPSTVNEIQHRFDFSDKKQLLSNRGILLELGLPMVNEVGFFGYGLNSFPALVDVESEPRLTSKKTITHWHNMYLDTLLDGGPFALLILIWLLFSQTRYSLARFRKTKDSEQKIFQLGILLLMLCVILVGFVDNTLSGQIISMLIWMLLGLSVI